MLLLLIEAQSVAALAVPPTGYLRWVFGWKGDNNSSADEASPPGRSQPGKTFGFRPMAR
eukprot:CAMPEP_0179464278 /NCGR_PEP_ID=MMETSP0799-20121207/46140_1 /TAXON_ID=46947 /ORGANISM="Geminigera cryophila, Strain CCMP2564" /LENGTH=58 /DNA_ID=CAMNT_0021267993 /DNA_START=578 /DNA_END=754 /DNA_ORIENTATION=+